MAGRGVADKHSAADHSEDAVAVVAMDYGYLAEREDGATPILFVKDRKHRWYSATCMPSKGTAHPFCAKTTAKAIALGGHRRIILRSDQEPAMVALK